MAKFTPIRGRMARIVRLDGCGNPALGPDSVVVTEGLITVGLSPQTQDSTAISVTNMAGKPCVNDTPPPQVTGYALEITMCGVDPNLVNLFTGNPLVYNDEVTPEAIGFRVNTGTSLDGSGFALELWTGVPAAVCGPGESQKFGYLLLPFIQGGIVGDLTVENGATNLTITGAQTKDGSGWGVGPFDIQRDASGQDSPLFDPADSRDHLHMQVVNLAPPVESEGASALGVPATSAAAGSPATLTPTNSYAPLNLADLNDGDEPVTASPTTAWTTGQYLTLRDGSRARWNGTTWIAA